MNVARMRILVVEDDSGLRETFKDTLRFLDQEVRVDWAFDAEHAEFLIKGSPKPYDLVVTDIHLRGRRTGLDLVPICQTGCFIPQIIISGMDRGEYQAKFEGSRFTAPIFLQKPFGARQLAAIVRQLFPPEQSQEEAA